MSEVVSEARTEVRRVSKEVQGYPFFQNGLDDNAKYLAKAREATQAENKLLAAFERTKEQA